MVLSTGQVFKSKDKSFEKNDMYVLEAKTNGSHTNHKYRLVFSDGYCDWFVEDELNIDWESVRAYDPNKDPDYVGMV